MKNWIHMNKLLILMITAVTLLAACSNQGSVIKNETGKTVKVGVLLPLTGATAWGGKAAQVAAKIAADEVNSQGIAGKYKIELAFADGECSPQSARSATQKLITQDKVQILIGEWCSSASIAVSQVAKQQKVPLLVDISTADNIAENGGIYTFQSAMSNKFINEREYKLLTSEFKFNAASILVENNDFGLSFRENMLNLLQKDAKKVVVDIKQDRADTNFYSAITKIQAAKSDIIIMSLSADQAANFVKAMAESGLRIPVVSDYPPPPYIFEKQVGKQAGQIGLVRGTFFIDNPNITPKQKEFVAKFEPEATKAVGETHSTTHWDLTSYDAVYLVADALKQGGPDPDSFAKAMNATKLDGLLGHYEFDQNRTVKPEGLPFIFIKNLPDGKLEIFK